MTKPGDWNRRTLLSGSIRQRCSVSWGGCKKPRRSCQRAIELNPTDSEAYLLRSDLRRQSPADNHIAELQSLIDSGVLSVHKIVQVSYALAKELDDVGAYESAFESFRRAADLRRKHLKYDISADISTIRTIAEVYTCDKFQDETFGFESEQPIFIVGLPRCGSTLVERILASHRAITSVGESNNFVIEMMKLVSDSRRGGKQGLVERSTEMRFEVLGERYVDSTRPVATGSEFFIDKMPLNFLYIGLIALALPFAKIVHVRRNPMDSCFAMYRCLFRHAYPFSYNFEELAQYYAAYDNLMQHWHRVLPGKIHDVFYEDLVHDPRGQAGEILRYCRLPWDEECLAYHESDAAAETASAAQVRRPIYRDSVDKWRNYDVQLTELRRSLAEHGIAVA